MPCYAMLSATRVEGGIAGDAPRVPKRRRGVGGGEEARANVKPAATCNKEEKGTSEESCSTCGLACLARNFCRRNPTSPSFWRTRCHCSWFDMPLHMPESCQSAWTASPHSASALFRAQRAIRIAAAAATAVTTHSHRRPNSRLGHGCPDPSTH